MKLDVLAYLRLLDQIPIMPFGYIIECIYCCYIVRKSLKIKSSIVSFVFTLFLSTLSSNVITYTKRQPVALFSNDYYPLICMVAWIAYFLCPYDVIYKATRYTSSVLVFFHGILLGRYLCLGFELAEEKHYAFITTFVFVIFLAFAKYLLFFIWAQLTSQSLRSIYVVFSELFVCALIYFFYPCIAENYSIPVDTQLLKSGISILMGIFELCRIFVPDYIFSTVWNSFSQLIQYFIPYYGRTWIPDQPPSMPRRRSFYMIG